MIRPISGLIPLVIVGSLATLLLLPIGQLLAKFAPEYGAAAMPFIAFGFGVVYVWVLLKKMKPRRDPVLLHADHSGIYADGEPLVMRADIAQAYVRPAMGPQRGRVSGSAGVFFVSIPPYPLTVEVLTRGAGQVNIDPGGQENAAAILTALGIPVTMCPPGFYDDKPSRARKVVSVVVVLVLLFVVVPIIARIVMPLVHGR